MVAKWPRRPTRSPWDDQAFFYWYVADKIEPVKLYAELYSPYVCAQRLQAGYDALATGVKARALLCTRRAGAACALAPSGAFPHCPSVRTRPFSSCEQRFCCVCSSQWWFAFFTQASTLWSDCSQFVGSACGPMRHHLVNLHVWV